MSPSNLSPSIFSFKKVPPNKFRDSWCNLLPQTFVASDVEFHSFPPDPLFCAVPLWVVFPFPLFSLSCSSGRKWSSHVAKSTSMFCRLPWLARFSFDLSRSEVSCPACDDTPPPFHEGERHLLSHPQVSFRNIGRVWLRHQHWQCNNVWEGVYLLFVAATAVKAVKLLKGTETFCRLVYTAYAFAFSHHFYFDCCRCSWCCWCSLIIVPHSNLLIHLLHSRVQPRMQGIFVCPIKRYSHIRMTL